MRRRLAQLGMKRVEVDEGPVPWGRGKFYVCLLPGTVLFVSAMRPDHVRAVRFLREAVGPWAKDTIGSRDCRCTRPAQSSGEGTARVLPEARPRAPPRGTSGRARDTCGHRVAARWPRSRSEAPARAATPTRPALGWSVGVRGVHSVEARSYGPKLREGLTHSRTRRSHAIVTCSSNSWCASLRPQRLYWPPRQNAAEGLASAGPSRWTVRGRMLGGSFRAADGFPTHDGF